MGEVVDMESRTDKLRQPFSETVSEEFAAELPADQLSRLVDARLDNAENLSSLDAKEELTKAPVSLPLGTAARLFKTFTGVGPSGSGGPSAGFVEDAKLTAFACALRDAVAEDIGDNMQLLSFGPGASFPDDDRRGRCDLLVRDFDPRLFDRIAAEPIGASLLTGVPGTGKSWWIWYAVHRLLNPAPGVPAPAIVWQSFKRGISSCVLFKDGKAFVGHLNAFYEQLGQTSTWYFVDGVLPQWVYARTVMVCPPKREVYKEWIKGRDIGLAMPLWTWPEIEKLWLHLYKGKLELARVGRNFELWYGGVPRLVLELPATSDGSRDAVAALYAVKSTSIEQVRVAIEGSYDVGPEASYRIIHQNIDRATFREIGRQYATTHIGELFLKKARILLASPSDTQSRARGQLVETATHLFMCSGCCFEYKLVDVPCSVLASGKRGAPSKARRTALQTALDQATAAAAAAAGTAPGQALRLTVPKLEQKLFTAGKRKAIGDFSNAAKLCASPSYLQPDSEGHPVIDACIYPDTLLSFKTATRAAGVDEEVLEKHLQSLPDLQRYYLDYYVPADLYPSFSPTPLLRTHPRVARTHMRVVRVESKLQLRPTVRAAVVQSRMLRADRGACLKARSM